MDYIFFSITSTNSSLSENFNLLFASSFFISYVIHLQYFKGFYPKHLINIESAYNIEPEDFFLNIIYTSSAVYSFKDWTSDIYKKKRKSGKTLLRIYL